MRPSILIFKDGIVEESFKAGLDLELPTDLHITGNNKRK